LLGVPEVLLLLQVLVEVELLLSAVVLQA